MKLHIVESEYDDAMSLYQQQKKSYDDAIQDYYSDYDQWYSKTPNEYFNNIKRSLRKVIIDDTHPFQSRLGYMDMQNGIRGWRFDHGTFRYNKPNNVTLTVYIDITEEKRSPGFTEDVIKTAPQIQHDLEKNLIKEGASIEGSEIEKDKYQVSIIIQFSFIVEKNPYSKPSKPTKPIKPKKPVTVKPSKVGPVDGVYTSSANKFYCDDYEIDDLFDIPNAEGVLKRAGWLKGGKVYIPKGTKFYIDGRDDYGDFITIEDGPMKGIRIHFVNYGANDPLSLQYYIDRYTM